MSNSDHKNILKPPRYTRRPFPPYAYTPGRDPHPTRDPDGHSYGTDAPALEQFDPERWQDCEEYLYAIDLLNHGYYWEAHESLEAIWLVCDRSRTPTGRFMQGLLQIGVGMLKLRQGQTAAAQSLWLSGREKIRTKLPNRHFCGIDVEWLDTAVSQLATGDSSEWPTIVLQGIAPQHKSS